MRQGRKCPRHIKPMAGCVVATAELSDRRTVFKPHQDRLLEKLQVLVITLFFERLDRDET
jgi:hypothetical protein